MVILLIIANLLSIILNVLNYIQDKNRSRQSFIRGACVGASVVCMTLFIGGLF